MWLPHLLHMFLPRDGQNSPQRVEDVLGLIHNTSPLLFLRPEVKFDITYIIVTLALLSSYFSERWSNVLDMLRHVFLIVLYKTVDFIRIC